MTASSGSNRSLFADGSTTPMSSTTTPDPAGRRLLRHRAASRPRRPGTASKEVDGGSALRRAARDDRYYQDYGKPANVQNRVELIINTRNGQYESQVAIRHEITQILVRTTSSDPYTSSDAATLLCQFITEWTNNQSGVPRDVAHLFTGRSINGGTIGIAADLGDICDNNGGCSGPILYDGAYASRATAAGRSAVPPISPRTSWVTLGRSTAVAPATR